MDGWPSTGITRVGGCTLSGGQVQLCSIQHQKLPQPLLAMFPFFFHEGRFLWWRHFTKGGMAEWSSITLRVQLAVCVLHVWPAIVLFADIICSEAVSTCCSTYIRWMVLSCFLITQKKVFATCEDVLEFTLWSHVCPHSTSSSKVFSNTLVQIQQMFPSVFLITCSSRAHVVLVVRQGAHSAKTTKRIFEHPVLCCRCLPCTLKRPDFTFGKCWVATRLTQNIWAHSAAMFLPNSFHKKHYKS